MKKPFRMPMGLCRQGRGALDDMVAASVFAMAALAPGCAPPPASPSDSNTPAVEEAARLNPNLSTALDISRFHISQLRAEMGLDADHGFQARNVAIDDQRVSHVHYDQMFRGVRVWNGDAIVHVASDGALRGITQDVKANITIGTRPSLSAAYALDRAHRDLRPRGPYAYKPTAELVVYPLIEERIKADRLRGPEGELNAEDIERVVTGYTLAYHVHSQLENGVGETAHVDHLIDAHTV